MLGLSRLGLGLSRPSPRSSGGGGGEELPEWLFTGDFASGEYAYQSEPAVYGDLFVTDESNWGSAAVVTEGLGITANGDAIATEPTSILLADGCTLVVGFSVNSTQGGRGFEVQIFNAPTYDKFISVLATTSGSRIADELSNQSATTTITSVGAHKAAFAFEAGRIALSVDGDEAVTLAYANFATFTEIAMTVLGAGSAITSCNAIAEAVDDATLATLSA